jgi:outer membrane protein assembly factor BamB
MRTTLLLLATTCCTLAATAAGDSWPQFRGPRGDGHAEGTGFPVRWSETENVRWKVAIPGKAWSSPVVWGKQVWVTNATPDGKKLSAVCVDRDRGTVVHDVTVFEIEKPAFCIAFNSYASPTPAVEEGRVYVHFGSAGTACLDTATGKTLWARQDLPCNHWRGPGSSPVLWRDLLLLTFDGYDLQYLAALDKKTGRTVWKKDRNLDYGTDNGDLKKGFSTPAVVDVGGKPQLVSPSAGGTAAYDPATGAELWRVKAGGMNVASPPLYGHGRLYVTTGDGGFRLYAVRPDGRGDVTATHVDWKYNRAVPSRCGPLLVGDLLFLVNEQGIVSCLEAKTGQLVWQERLKGTFSASPLYADGHIYYCSQEGVTYVAEAGRTWKLLATNRLDDGFMASPAAAGRALYLRTKTHLYRVEGKE